MFDYTVSPNNSPEQFRHACGIIEQAYPQATKRQLLVDVDGTTIQTYTKDGKDIDVFDDYDVGAVFVKSDIDLSRLFLT
ncbi:MAG: hypothetical protein ACI4JY_02170 [Oscillospiraceae bacterium]